MNEDLYGTLWQLGSEWRDDPIPRQILDRLAELKMIEVLDGKPSLTKFGWRTFSRIEAGDDLPELE